MPEGRRVFANLTVAENLLLPFFMSGVPGPERSEQIRRSYEWFPPLEPALWTPYREECLARGRPDPGEYPRQGPIFLWISQEPEKDWERLLPHVLHQLRSYSEWTIEAYGRPVGPYAKDVTPESVRRSGAYQVLAPEQALALAEALGPHSVFYLNPLLAGIEPARARRMLDLYEREVHPHLEALRR